MNKRKEEGFTPLEIARPKSPPGAQAPLEVLHLTGQARARSLTGFTLIELLIVSGIMLVLAAVAFSNYAEFKNKRTLETETDKLVARAREVMERSRSQVDGSQWGVHFANPSGDGNDFYEIWKGTNYASGIVTEKIFLDNFLKFSDPADGATEDVIFAKATGLPTANSTIVIQSISGGGTATINIDSIGRIDYSFN